MCVYLRILVQLLLASTIWAHTCTPASNSHGAIIPNTDLPTEGVRMYFQEAEQAIPSFIMLRASQIEPTGFTGSMPTRAVWCQSANTNAHNGTWFQPPGDIPPGYSVVPTEDIDSPISEPYQTVICPGQVGLVRDTGVAAHEGLLQCVINDEHNITHTLTVGVYTGSVYDGYAGPVVDPNMQFSLVSTRDTDPPQFTLTFNSSFGPPSVVGCVVDGSSLNTSQYSVHREVKNAHFVLNGDLDSVNASQPDTLDVTEVTVTVRVRQAGVYVCTVTVMGRQDSMPQHAVALGTQNSTANITIAATPISVSASRVSTDSIMVTWSAPSPAPDGYEVFYQTTVDGSAVSGGITSNTELTLTGLLTLVEYTIFVVAFSDTNTIPSPHSNTVTVPAVSTMNVTMTTTPNGTLYEATSVDILCEVTIVGVFSNTSGYTIIRQWLGSTSITAGQEYTITNNTLHINQLSRARDNNRNITCVVSLTLTSGAQHVQQECIVLTVEALSNDLFTPDVIIPGVPTAGDNFNIICKLDGVVERLVSGTSVSLSFFNPPGGAPGDQSQDGSAYIIPRIFTPGKTSDVGTYTCIATAVIPSLGAFLSFANGRILQIQTPPPYLSLTITPSTTPLYECTPVNLTCSAVLNTNVVNTAVTVSIVWTGPSGEQLTNSSHVTVMDMPLSSPYTSVVVFDQVDDTDSGDYQCNITVSPADNNTAILPAMNITNIQLTVTALPSNLSSSSVIVVGSVAMTTTTATVMFTVERSALSQTRIENYIIRYRGVERDNPDKQSAIITSTSGTTNSSYNFKLTDLQANTTYKYSIIIITTCIGNTSTTERSFVTPYELKAPASPPVNCTNTTFLPHLVTLTWSALPPLVPGEIITGYTLNCTTITNHSLTSLTSTTSTITITSGILPYTNYSCKLTAQNNIGSSPPANCTFETSQDAPGDSPQEFSYTPGANSIVFTWKPPTQPNGLITQYTLTVITVQRIQTVVLDGSTLSYLICNILPLQQVRASISAATQVGEGPVVNIIAMTAAQGFSGVKQLRTANSQNNILNISWAPPSKPHGLITQYSIVVENNNTEVISAHQTHSRTTLTTRLIAGAVFGVPYYITVAPLDSCNTSGDSVSIVAFSKELNPLVAVMFTANRSTDGAVITVSWQPVTLEQARGFFVYRVIISPATSSKRQAAIMIDVPAHNQTCITVSDLDPSVEYTVSVGVVNKNNMELAGPTLPPVTIPSDSSSNGISIIIVVGSVLASCVLVGISVIAVFIIIAVILKSHLQPDKKGGVPVHDGMKMTECAAYGMHQPHLSCDLHKPTGEPEYEEVKT